ncbi:MAG: hypothetical protein JRJ60_16810 [Deltaproteobacteria bacterium]|nr:hypothetical protein [Deltaproteobacteria bacterium]
MKASRVVVLLAVLAAWVLLPCAGEAREWIKQGEEKFQFYGGAFFPAFDTSLRVDNKTLGEGTDVNLEDDLNFDESETTFYVSGYWRFASRHRVGVGFFRFSRDAGATLNEQIQIGDEIFPVGAGINSEFDFNIIPVNYAYSFMKREKFELAGTVGLHWFNMTFKVKGNASLGTEDLDAEVKAKADAPLPLLGLKFDYFFTPRWTAGVLAEAFYLSASSDTFSFSGSLFNFRLSTEYWIWNNVGVGGAINYFNLNVDVKDDEWRGEFDYNYWGPQIYMVVRF